MPVPCCFGPSTQMAPRAARRGPDDDGFTLVEIVVAIVLVGVLSAVVVVGVGRLTSQGADAACTASKDAARAGVTVYQGSNLAYPTTLTEMTSGAPAALSLPSGVTVDGSGLVATGDGWTLTMVPGSAGGPPTFVCSTDVPDGFTVGPNGHFYRFVAAPGISQSAAAAAAASFTFDGLTGYLATITSASEQAAVYAVIGNRSAWVDGNDTAVEGVWRWSSGPEAGQQYASGGAGVSGSYVNWAGGQPDNANNEDCMHFYVHWPNLWNDVPCSWPSNDGYVVELGR